MELDSEPRREPCWHGLEGGWALHLQLLVLSTDGHSATPFVELGAPAGALPDVASEGLAAVFPRVIGVDRSACVSGRGATQWVHLGLGIDVVPVVVDAGVVGLG